MIGLAEARYFMDFHHESVLLDEVIEVFVASKPSVVVDCTLGGAGHSRALLEAIDGLHLIGIDRDPTAIEIASERLRGVTIRSTRHAQGASTGAWQSM